MSSSSGSIWARTRGQLRVDAESGEPARRDDAEQPPAPLVSAGARSEHVPSSEPTIEGWLRRGDGQPGWSSLDTELSDS
ncbi:MAG TPA: hypothetical protein VFB57_03050 [Gaiellaceae bacterium]|jgi:hypothetical protein|nr:hypothetical protein [Gaiellaceae bacterium]